VRRGEDYRHPRDRETGRVQHTLPVVMREMILQVTRDFGGLPDVRTLTASDIRFFYEGLRAELREITKPRNK